MKQYIALFAIVVKDYDEAISFYTKKLGFILIEDTQLTEEKRWVIVKHAIDAPTGILLARAKNAVEEKSIGFQTGGRVGFFLFTDDFDAYYQGLLAAEVEIVRPPEQHEYGQVAVFADLYGNLWDIIEPS